MGVPVSFPTDVLPVDLFTEWSQVQGAWSGGHYIPAHATRNYADYEWEQPTRVPNQTATALYPEGTTLHGTWTFTNQSTIGAILSSSSLQVSVSGGNQNNQSGNNAGGGGGVSIPLTAPVNWGLPWVSTLQMSNTSGIGFVVPQGFNAYATVMILTLRTSNQFGWVVGGNAQVVTATQGQYAYNGGQARTDLVADIGFRVYVMPH